MPDFIGRLLVNDARKTNAASRRLFFFCAHYIIRNGASCSACKNTSSGSSLKK
jgi:hypothetical protein